MIFILRLGFRVLIVGNQHRNLKTGERNKFSLFANRAKGELPDGKYQ